MTANRKAIVTGANGAIGGAIAEGLARVPGFEVVLVARDPLLGQDALEAVRRAADNPPLRLEVADLSRRDSVREFASRWQGPLHVLVNNAAQCPPRRTETPDGLEVQFATNILGYLWMMEFFEPHLAEAGAARVVNVASYWAGGLAVDDLQFKRRRYHNDAAYRQSKQANRMLTRAWSEKWESRGIAVNACHPGDVDSKLSNDLGFGGHESPAQGADTPVWLAASPQAEGLTGGYFSRRRRERCEFMRDTAAIERLATVCAQWL